MRWILSLGAVAGIVGGCSGCSGGGGTNHLKAGPNPPLAVPEIKVDLPSIPSKIEVTTSQPTQGNAPDKRSPVLDILKNENEREMGALKKQKDPAHYLA